jgi:arginine metabolism regulation protein II
MSSDSLDASLSRLDARVKDADSAQTQDTTVGPFGIIDFRAPGVLPPPTATSEQVDSERPNPIFEDGFDDPSPITEGLLSNPNDFLDWADILALDYENDIFFSDATFPNELLNLNSQITDSGGPFRPGDVSQLHVTDAGPVDQTISSPPGSIDLTSPTIQKLLRYFRDQVVPRFSAIPEGYKSPWKISNASAAVQTLAEMTYLGSNSVKHANLANLYAVIAISAHSLACVPEDSSHSIEYWEELSTQASNQAKAHLQVSLQKETQGVGKCKYKDQLMMILAMASYAV